ncbi:hypothetical protein BH11PSE2_BH11PSE2_07020 [soil metagenome]
MNPSAMRQIPTTDMKPADLSGLRVLVVDDNVNTVRLVADVLRASGVGQVFSAYTGVQALTGLQIWRPSIIFLDWQMPSMDGLELVRIIRKAAIHPDQIVPDPKVPIIMLTGRKREKDVEMARMAGVNEFVAKPFTPAALIGRIQMVMTKPRDFVVVGHYVGPDRRRRMELTYTGPMRRAVDPDEVIDQVERELTRRTMTVEVEAMQRLIEARGASDRETMQMCYRAMQHNAHRARAVRDTAIEQASNSLLRYIEAMGGPTQADPKVVAVHMDALRNLLSLGDADARSAGVINSKLDEAVSKKINSRSTLL